ncbi:MAG TPA: TolC family protein [Dissulfurispiraceae bacterium]
MLLAWTVPFLAAASQALTLDEALTLAKENLPSYKAAMIRVKSTEALYQASLGPYLPSLDASTNQQRIYVPSQELTSRNYELTLSYTLFDGGKRRANRNIALLNLGADREELRKNLLDLEYNVKVAFFTAMAQKEVLDQRTTQLKDAQKDYDVAEGRYKAGVAKISDRLQASVRLEQARYNLVQAEGDLKKSLSDLHSLTGVPLDSPYALQGALEADTSLPGRDKLSEAALRRPEVKQAENALKISENNRSSALSTFFPVISASATYTKTGGSAFGAGTSGISGAGAGAPGSGAPSGITNASSFTGFFPEEKAIGITATWNIFELGKFFRYKSSRLEKEVSSEKVSDIKRQLLLGVHKTYEDFVTASNQLGVAQQQLKQAEYNYAQALGEYKVGKSDILSLVQAESLLATAREQLVTSRLNIILSRSLIEKTAGILRTSLP